MSWVTINRERCDNCRICSLRCPRCFTDKEGAVSVHAGEENCIICGHCVALCPRDAITHSLMNMDAFEPITERVSFDPDDFLRFLCTRRSHRHYRKKDIPRTDLDKLLKACNCSPTGSNLQTVQVTVITNKNKIKLLSDLSVDFFMQIMNDVERQVEEQRTQGTELPLELSDMLSFARRYSLMGRARDMGIDPILHSAPAVMIFHSPPSPSTPKDDCIIAAQTVVLTAMTMGLGTCYIGLLLMAAGGSPAVMNELGLPDGHTPYSVLTLGYPRLTFLKTVDRKPLKVEWIT